MSTVVLFIVASGLACLLAFVWLGLVAATVPAEQRAFRDPAPAWWRWLGWPGHAVAHWIGGWLPRRFRARTTERLRHAGLEFALSPEQMVSGQLFAAFGAVVVAVLVDLRPGLPPVAWLITAAVIGGAMPAAWLRDRAARRLRMLGRTLPFYLDILTLAVEAGANVTSALQHAVDKGPGGPLADELQRVLRDVRAGRTRAEAMRALAERLALPAISNWVGAVLAAEKQGASLGGILRAQAEQRRLERFVRAEQMALKAPVKMLFPLVVCIFPCTFVVVFFPIAVRLVFEGLIG
jgi:tight adherence protein C